LLRSYSKENHSVSFSTLQRFPPVKLLPNAERKRILVYVPTVDLTYLVADSGCSHTYHSACVYVVPVEPVSLDRTWSID
jgi:hypothetical protein